MHLYPGDVGLSFEGKCRYKSREGMTSYGNSQHSTLPYSFSQSLDPMKSYPSANKAILLDRFHECAPNLPPRHLADASWVRVSLVSTVGIYTLSPIQLCTHICAHEQKSMGLLECLTFTGQVLYKAPQDSDHQLKFRDICYTNYHSKAKIRNQPRTADSSTVNNISYSS